MNLEKTPVHNAGKPRRLHKEVETLIRQHIEDRKLETGSQLPTEAEFCQMFNVSRSTVRHALERLELAGLISRTRGRGTFLRDPAQAEAIPAREPPPLYSRTRARGRHTVGVIFSYASEIDVMQTAILRGIEHAAKSRGYNVLFGRTDDWDEAGEAKAISEMYRIGVGGMVIMPISNRTTTAGVRMLVERQVPVVLVDRYLSALDTSYVVSDNHAGAYRATEHLILLGYTAFEFVLDKAEGTPAEQLATTSIRDRYAGYCQALRDYNRAGAIKSPTPVNHASKDAIGALLACHPAGSGRPPAIVALHDHLATEIINSAAQINLRPPADFAITGFDDLPVASHLSVPLTTVVQPRYDIGFRAGHLLIDKIAGNSIRNDKVSLLVSLLVRESCGAKRLMRQQTRAPVSAPAALQTADASTEA